MSQIMVYVPYNPLTSDLYLHNYGRELCMSGHYYGPAIREYYLLHYVIKGKGIFRTGKETYNLKAGQGFLIFPNVITYYEADKDDPWEYCWVGFNGAQAEKYMNKTCFSVGNPILNNLDANDLPRLFEELIVQTNLDSSAEISIIGHLYLIIGKLIELYPKELIKGDKNSDTANSLVKKEEYVNKVISFINMNYANKITVQQIANYIGLDRSYLCSLFKKYLNSSIQEYLVQHRIDKACLHLTKHELSISDISRSVGYDDPLLFSKIFKKYKGVSPKKYRSMYT